MADQETAVADAGIEFRIMNWIGIVNQLSATRANQLLENGPVPFAQFKILLHFRVQDYKSHTVTEVAHAFQQPQPGTTKTIQKLEKKGFLRSEPHPDDRRARLFSITPLGRSALGTAKQLFDPLTEELFEGWQAEELNTFFAMLNRLKRHLDENRV
ncbi:MAG: MarR family winged helix-turn-helix transcriptional regulator [Alphaproteobacteria bacterium]|nr:MarR family winged helix-turn-helix transcriptional regulator [Alphaproteobacteria bacterium]